MPDRAVLITGVGGEIGGYLAHQFLAEGWLVCGLDQKPPNSELANVTFEQCDLTDGASTEEKINIFHDRVAAFDVVINCAGLIANAPLISFVDGQLAHHDFELWNQVICSCLSSAFYVSACTVPRMVSSRKKGVIVNVSSICANGNPGQAAYSAAKAGLNGLTMSMAKELGPLGIRVVSLVPGYFDTASTRDHVAPDKLKELARNVPLKRLGKIEEVWTAIEFIVSNTYVNGTLIELDGGLVV